jgi:hypothetical protein
VEVDSGVWLSPEFELHATASAVMAATSHRNILLRIKRLSSTHHSDATVWRVRHKEINWPVTTRSANCHSGRHLLAIEAVTQDYLNRIVRPAQRRRPGHGYLGSGSV